MCYNLPLYPSNRLETMLHMHHQISTQFNDFDIVGGFIPVGEISQVGIITMSIIRQLTTQHDYGNITILYDANMLDNNNVVGLIASDINSGQTLITSFGHHITVLTHQNVIPRCVEEVCCMIQLYQTITHISVYSIDQIPDLNQSKNPIIWIGSNLHHGLDIDSTLTQDNATLTQLQSDQLNDNTFVGYDVFSTMIGYYQGIDRACRIIPLHYHNSSMYDGQLDHTSGYCSGVVVISLV